MKWGQYKVIGWYGSLDIPGVTIFLPLVWKPLNYLNVHRKQKKHCLQSCKEWPWDLLGRRPHILRRIGKFRGYLAGYLKCRKIKYEGYEPRGSIIGDRTIRKPRYFVTFRPQAAYFFIFETEAAFMLWLLGPQTAFVFALRPKPPIWHNNRSLNSTLHTNKDHAWDLTNKQVNNIFVARSFHVTYEQKVFTSNEKVTNTEKACCLQRCTKPKFRKFRKKETFAGWAGTAWWDQADPRIVQFRDSLLISPSIGPEPRREERESGATCGRMVGTTPSFSPPPPKKKKKKLYLVVTVDLLPKSFSLERIYNDSHLQLKRKC